MWLTYVKETATLFMISHDIFCLLPLPFLLKLYVPLRLFFMLRRFPIESKGRQKKLNEVCNEDGCFLTASFTSYLIM